MKLINTEPDTLLPQNNEVGGQQEKCNFVSDVGLISSNITKDFMSMEEILGLEKVKSRTDFPGILDPTNATFSDIALHGLIRQRLSKGTVTRNLRYLRYMETHEKPVDLHNPTYQNWLNHIDYREQFEFDNCKDGKGIGAIRHEWQAMRMLLSAYGISIWPYKTPQQIDRIMFVPILDTVYDVINADYSKDWYKNIFAQYYLTFKFVIGWRPPSEPAFMKCSFIDLDKGTNLVKVVEPKRKFKERLIEPKEILLNTRRKSLKNWIDHIRPKVVSQYSDDYLFIDEDGKPFWDDDNLGDNLRMYVNRIIEPKVYDICPDYYPYCARHFCATARLIRTKLETGGFDIYSVNDFMGHEKLQTTKDYVKNTGLYVRQFNFDWIYRILKADSKISKENTEKSKELKKRVFRPSFLREINTPSAGLEPATVRLTAECSTN